MTLLIGPFELDEPRFELRRLGELVPIQPKVLDLICYLVRHRDRVVTKDELFDAVWPGVVVGEASLSQAISAARRAFGDDGAAQSHIKTVRGRGFRFVAECQEAAPVASEPDADDLFALSSTATNQSLDIETRDDSREGEVAKGTVPHLYVLMHADAPMSGGARHCLSGLDEVDISRGSKRGVRRDTAGATKQLQIHIPGSAVSRHHARVARARSRWHVVDNGSKNGLYVNGDKVRRAELKNGDVFECGRTFFLYADEPHVEALVPDVDSARLTSVPLASLLPAQQGARHVLQRIARAALHLALVGEAGAGKESAARAFHRLSGRQGQFVIVESTAVGAASGVTWRGEAATSLFDIAAGGTLFVDPVDGLSDDAQVSLLHALDEARDVRLIAGSSQGLQALVDAGVLRSELAGRLSGYTYRVPALRDRLGDFGLLCASIAEAKQFNTETQMSVEAGLWLLKHTWPYNLRELTQVLERAFALSAGTGVIERAHLPT